MLASLTSYFGMQVAWIGTLSYVYPNPDALAVQPAANSEVDDASIAYLPSLELFFKDSLQLRQKSKQIHFCFSVSYKFTLSSDLPSFCD